MIGIHGFQQFIGWSCSWPDDFEIELPPGMLLSQDIPRLERNSWKNFPHVDETRARRIGRRPCSGSQEERSAGVRNEEQSSAAVQAAYAKANLHLV